MHLVYCMLSTHRDELHFGLEKALSIYQQEADIRSASERSYYGLMRGDRVLTIGRFGEWL
jgi:hypothetical protein